MRRPKIVGAIAVVVAVVLSASCFARRPGPYDLSDAIVDAVLQMNRTDRVEVDVTHVLGLDVPALVALIPPSGVDASAVPSGVSPELVAQLTDMQVEWNGRAFIAIIWDTGSVSGNEIDGRVTVPRPMIMVKQPGSEVVVRLRREQSGVIAVVDLR